MKRLVALKVVSLGPHVAPGGLARFRREAELVARVQHANVVQVYEAGEWQADATAPAVPYLAMEYVEGGTLAARLAAGPLAPTVAAACLEALALGMQAAHERGVVHRDLKPSNVLLAAGAGLGTPRISDFGLARALTLDPAESPGDHQTRPGAVVGTPAYMAPEQAGGAEPAGPAADVYALGAVLYECLTGRPPFCGETLLETLVQVRTLEPVPPRRLRPGVPRDLQTVALKCLEKGPARRYVAARELAADLRRYLDGRPIHARPVGPLRRLAKWVRRRPVVAGLIGLCLLCLATVVVGAGIYERRLRGAVDHAVSEGERADANYRKARDTIQKMLRSADDPQWRSIPRMSRLHREQVEAALAFYEDIAAQKGDAPQVQYEVAAACLEAARLQIDLGRMGPTQARARQELELADDLVRRQPDDLQTALLRYNALGTLARALDVERMIAYLEQSVVGLEALLERQPDAAEARRQLAANHVTLGAAYLNQNSVTQSLRCFRRAVELNAELVTANPDNHEQRSRLARSRLNLAVALSLAKDSAEARRQQRLAEADFEVLLIHLPDHKDTIDGLAVLRLNVVYWLAPEAGLEYVSRNLPMLEAARKREPDDADYRDRLWRTHGVRAQILAGLKRHAEAVEAWERMMDLASKDEAERRRDGLAELLLRAGDHARAADQLDLVVKNAPPTKTAASWKELAGLYGEAAALADKDARLSTGKKREFRDRYQAAARSALFEAGKAAKHDLLKPRKASPAKP